MPKPCCIEIATLNGPKQTVVSGDAMAIDAFCENLNQAGIKAKALVVSHAFHSALMQPILDTFEEIAGSLDYQPFKTKLVSNVTGTVLSVGEMNGQYWRAHVRQPVDFLSGMQTLFDEGCDVFLEMGPHPILVGMGIRCVPEDAPEYLSHKANWLASIRRKRDDQVVVSSSLIALYLKGSLT
jgi:acyl transferase domain-containing protein